MSLLRLGPNEIVRADMTAPARTLVFPFLELVLITGVCWIGIGYLDQPGLAVDPVLRNAVVGLWAVLAVWRFVLPLLRARRQRFVVTDRRIIARAGTFRSRVDSIPLRDVHFVRRYRTGLSVSIYGHDRPLYFADVPRAKKLERLITEPLPPAPVRYR